MLKPLILTVVFVAAGSLALCDSALAKPRSKAKYDPNEIVCKDQPRPGSRIARNKQCFTASEWAEMARVERIYLMERQRNGAK